jgi:hypothetical protein
MVDAEEVDDISEMEDTAREGFQEWFSDWFFDEIADELGDTWNDTDFCRGLIDFDHIYSTNDRFNYLLDNGDMDYFPEGFLGADGKPAAAEAPAAPAAQTRGQCGAKV